jgi:hypothetical protein
MLRHDRGKAARHPAMRFGLAKAEITPRKFFTLGTSAASILGMLNQEYSRKLTK